MDKTKCTSELRFWAKIGVIAVVFLGFGIGASFACGIGEMFKGGSYAYEVGVSLIAISFVASLIVLCSLIFVLFPRFIDAIEYQEQNEKTSDS